MLSVATCHRDLSLSPSQISSLLGGPQCLIITVDDGTNCIYLFVRRSWGSSAQHVQGGRSGRLVRSSGPHVE